MDAIRPRRPLQTGDPTVQNGKIWRPLAAEIEGLRSLFPPSEQGAAAAKWFDEFLQENELDLALHAVCDFLLAPDAPPASPQIRSAIEGLHAKMEIVGDCVALLRHKAAASECYFPTGAEASASTTAASMAI